MIGIFELIVLLMVICIITAPFTIFAIVDILRSNFRGNDKTVWLLVVIFLSLPGLILYRTVGKKQKVKS
jgi:hypothetical protein